MIWPELTQSGQKSHSWFYSALILHFMKFLLQHLQRSNLSMLVLFLECLGFCMTVCIKEMQFNINLVHGLEFCLYSQGPIPVIWSHIFTYQRVWCNFIDIL